MSPKPRTKLCGKCRQPFQCNGAAGEAGCWCEKHPPLNPLETPYKDCLCPKCLGEETRARDGMA